MVLTVKSIKFTTTRPRTNARAAYGALTGRTAVSSLLSRFRTHSAIKGSLSHALSSSLSHSMFLPLPVRVVEIRPVDGVCIELVLSSSGSIGKVLACVRLCWCWAVRMRASFTYTSYHTNAHTRRIQHQVMARSRVEYVYVFVLFCICVCDCVKCRYNSCRLFCNKSFCTQRLRY